MPHPILLRCKRFCWTAAFLALAFHPSASPAQQQVDPYGNCCVASVVMTGFSAWTATCGSCATNPGTYAITQPDPEKLVFLGPGGISAGSRYEAAQAICNCPSQTARRAWEKRMRTFGGN